MNLVVSRFDVACRGLGQVGCAVDNGGSLRTKVPGAIDFSNGRLTERVANMIELIVLEMAVARHRAKRAEPLKQAKTMLDDNYGLAVSLPLCGPIRAGLRQPSGGC